MGNINIKKNPERFDPDDNSFLEQTKNHHIKRYKFAKTYLKDYYNILDLCCGTGYGSNILKNETNSIIGLDINQKSIEKAKIKYSNCAFFTIDIIKNYPKMLEFDLIVFFEAIEHFKENEVLLLLENIYKYGLKQNGTLIISTPRDINIDNKFHFTEWHPNKIVPILNNQYKKVNIYGQSWQTGEIIQDYNNVNDFYIYVCEK